MLARDARRSAQILILVPEINLTPQLEGNIRARFPGMLVATLHSGLSEGERMLHWLAAHQGRAAHRARHAAGDPGLAAAT